MLYEVTLSTTLFDQLCINRFHYNSDDAIGTSLPAFRLIRAMGFSSAAIVAGAFESGTLASDLQAIQSTSLKYVSIYARALYDNVDFYENPFPSGIVGEATGEPLAPFNAFGFFSSRVRTDVKRGFKRFAGVTEFEAGVGGFFIPAVLTLMDTVAAGMSGNLIDVEGSSTLTFVPAVLGLERTVDVGGKVSYAPYATNALQLEHSALGVVYSPYPSVRSQVSRQYGRGA